MKGEPKLKQLDRAKMLIWLQNHPTTNPASVQFIKNTVKSRREATDWINATWLLEKDTSNKADKD
jgi:hypothetical protein